MTSASRNQRMETWQRLEIHMSQNPLLENTLSLDRKDVTWRLCTFWAQSRKSLGRFMD